jgi:cbb3-type cytochrome c oxidase subunit III
MKRRLRLIAPVALIALLVVLNNSTAASKPSTTAVDGSALFSSKCVICHGKDGAGLPNWRAKGQPDFTNVDWQKSRTDTQIAETIKNGRGKFMPAFKEKLSDDEIVAIVGRVRQLGKRK